jgi:uncharacterized protein with PIN domain
MHIENRSHAVRILDALQEVLLTTDVGMIVDDDTREVLARHHAVLGNLINCVAILTGGDELATSDACPRCKTKLDMERPALNAVSRLDNKTYICSPCGSLEAMWDYTKPGKDLPPLDQQIILS